MKKITASLPFFKTVLLSISILVFSSVSAYAGRTNQPNPVKFQLLHSDGFVTVVSNDGRVSKPYPELSINQQTGWIVRGFDAAQDDDFPWIPSAEAKCPNGSCIVNIGGKDVAVSSLFENGSAAPLRAAGVGASSQFLDDIHESVRRELENREREICEILQNCPAPPTPITPPAPSCNLKCMKDRADEAASKI